MQKSIWYHWRNTLFLKYLRINKNSEIEIDINSDAELPGKTHLNNPLKEDDSELATLTAELETQKDKYLRLFAEFDNYKRRTAKERIELIQTAGKDIIVNLLEILKKEPLK